MPSGNVAAGVLNTFQNVSLYFDVYLTQEEKTFISSTTRRYVNITLIIVEDEYGVPDEGWQLDVILECYQKEGSGADADADIHDGYDPTPQTSYEFFH